MKTILFYLRLIIRTPLVFVCFITASLAAEESDPSIFKNLDVFEIEMAADPQISPDGSQVAYVRKSNDIMTDRVRSNIWVISSDGKSHRPVLSGKSNYSSPRWSPSGDRIAYISGAEGGSPQLYVRWMDTGQTALLSNLQKVPSSITWSPDGARIAFSMLVPAEETTFAKPPAKPKGAHWAPAVKVIDRLFYRSDGQGYLEHGYDQLFTIPSDGGTPQQLTSGGFNHKGPLSWSPDGSILIFSANRKEDWEHDWRESEIWSLHIDSGELSALTNRNGPDQAPTYSPDGSKIAYLGFDDSEMEYENARVYLMNADGSDKRVLMESLDRSIEAVRWSGSSNQLMFLYDERGKKRLASLSLQDQMETLADDVGGTSPGRPYSNGGSFSVSGNGAYAYTSKTPYRPSDVAAGRLGSAPQKLTRLNEDFLAHKTLGQIEELAWTSSVGDHGIQGWVIKPPHFDPDKQYPLILEIHSGPLAAYGPTFSLELQLYAAAGYVVLYCNPRGSTSYGYDFANEIHHDYPSKDYDDLMSGVDAVVAKGYIDEDHLYVTGGSGGGVLTAWIVGKTDRFRAAVSAKPVINWTSEMLTSDIMVNIKYWFPKTPWEAPEYYWKYSPLSLVGNVSTPTMLITGEQDHRTPITESEQYYQALKFRKIESALVRIPEASHGILARPSHLIAKVDNILGWFKKYKAQE